MDAVTKIATDEPMRLTPPLPAASAADVSASASQLLGSQLRPFAPSMEIMRLRAYALMLIADLAIILISFMIAGGIRSGNLLLPTAVKQGLVLLPIFTVLALYNRTYSVWSLTSASYGIARAFLAFGLATGLFLLVTFYAKTSGELSRIAFTMGSIFTLFWMTLLRLLVVRNVAKNWGPGARNTLVIDDGGPPVRVEDAYVVNSKANGLDINIDNPSALDRLGRCIENMDRVIVSCPMENRHHWAFFLRAAGIDGEVVTEVGHELGAIGLKCHDGFSSMVVSARPLSIRQRAIKRLIDISFSLTVLILISPLLLLIALLIKLEDGGSVFFMQRRMGRGNRFFNMYKFRSMTEEQCDLDGVRSASRDDNRVTRIGGILRRTSIDELPQILNVLRGDMSLVGPRPHALGSQAGTKLFWEVDVRYWHRHSLRPGLTGLAQIRGFRGATEREVDLSKRLQADLEYIANWTPWRDIYIMLSTFRVLVHSQAF